MKKLKQIGRVADVQSNCQNERFHSRVHALPSFYTGPTNLSQILSLSWRIIINSETRFYARAVNWNQASFDDVVEAIVRAVPVIPASPFKCPSYFLAKRVAACSAPPIGRSATGDDRAVHGQPTTMSGSPLITVRAVRPSDHRFEAGIGWSEQQIASSCVVQCYATTHHLATAIFLSFCDRPIRITSPAVLQPERDMPPSLINYFVRLYCLPIICTPNVFQIRTPKIIFRRASWIHSSTDRGRFYLSSLIKIYYEFMS